jgi:hypothetical protein
MLKQMLVAVIAASGVNAAAAQTPATPTCAIPSIVDKADLKPLSGSDLMTVPVEINGKPRQFLLDIGTGPTEVSDVAVKELALPGANQSGDTLLNGAGYDNGFGQFRNLTQGTQMQAAMFDVTGARSATDYQARVRIADFGIGGNMGHNLQFLVANDREMGKTEPYDGLLTANFFARYDIDLDFGGKQITFLTPTACDDPGQVVLWPHGVVAIVPMKLAGGKITVPVMINGHTVNAALDFGSAQTVMRRDIAETVFGLHADTPDMTPDGGARDGAGQLIYRHTFPQIAFEGVTANNVPVRIQVSSMVHRIDRTPILGSRAQFAADPSSRIPDLALGMDMLHQLHLYAAFGQDKLYVTAAN